MIFFGIDPGKSGAVATISEDRSAIGFTPFSSWKTMAIFLTNHPTSEKFGVLEKVHAFPGQGVSSMFSFGANYGGWKSLLELTELSYVEVSPQTWQKKILGTFPKGEGKKRALDYILKRFPQFTFSNKSKAEGPVDALCMALYAKYIHTNKV